MDRGNRGRGFRGGRGRGRGATSIPLKGMFADGIWHCNCTPRLPAEHFKVKKEGKNKGRWFYTCQQGEPKRCDFFLWDEDAKLREEATVIGNSRSETRRDPDVQEGWQAGRASEVRYPALPTPTLARQVVVPQERSPASTPSPTLSPAKKRNVGEMLDNDHDDEASQPWSLTGEEEAAFARAAASNAALETPQKAQKIGVYATPATTTTDRRSVRKLPWLPNEPATPVSALKPNSVATYFATPSKQPAPRIKFEDEDEAAAPNPEATPQTPPPHHQTPSPTSPTPPSRFKNALQDPADASSTLTTAVLTALAPLKVPPDKLANVRSILSTHDLRAQGVKKGRDISRLALKAKEARIRELEARIASLEAQREVDRSVIAGLRWKRESGFVGEETDDEDGAGGTQL